MNLPHQDFAFTLLTPAMVGGAVVEPVRLNNQGGGAGPRKPDPSSGSEPEMRTASIRGQIRWWHRFGGISPVCSQVWGRTEPVPDIASRIRLEILPRSPFVSAPVRMLPHAQRDNSNPNNPWAKLESHRRGINAEETFTLRLTRLVGCPKTHWEAAQKAVKLWLLLGGLGVRSSRAAGSVWPIGEWVPQDDKAFGETLRELGFSRAVRLTDSELPETAASVWREIASDTVNNARYLGTVGDGQRVPSPVKMKVVRLGKAARLLWVGPDRATLDGALHVLSGKRLGAMLWIDILP